MRERDEVAREQPVEKDVVRQQPPPEKGAGTRKSEERPETAEHPAPDIEHKPEPDAENLVPRRQGPGTL